MSSGSGLPGEERFLEWAHRRAYESRIGPRLHALESGVPYGSAVLVYLPARPARAQAAG